MTIKDVATLAGISSISTVSRTLSGKILVAVTIRGRVMNAVEKFDYKPNAFVRGLKSGQTNIIALIIPNIRNPIFPEAARRVEEGHEA